MHSTSLFFIWIQWPSASSHLNAHHIDTHHLPRERLVGNSCNDLLPVRPILAIVDLAIVAVYNSDSNGCARRHSNVCLEVFLVDNVPDRGIVIQPIILSRLRDIDSPMRPIRSADRTTRLEIWMFWVRCVAACNCSRLENATYAQGHVIHHSRLSAKCE